jgi:hypothetical protein
MNRIEINPILRARPSSESLSRYASQAPILACETSGDFRLANSLVNDKQP